MYLRRGSGVGSFSHASAGAAVTGDGGGGTVGGRGACWDGGFLGGDGGLKTSLVGGSIAKSGERERERNVVMNKLIWDDDVLFG